MSFSVELSIEWSLERLTIKWFISTMNCLSIRTAKLFWIQSIKLNFNLHKNDFNLVFNRKNILTIQNCVWFSSVDSVLGSGISHHKLKLRVVGKTFTSVLPFFDWLFNSSHIMENGRRQEMTMIPSQLGRDSPPQHLYDLEQETPLNSAVSRPCEFLNNFIKGN